MNGNIVYVTKKPTFEDIDKHSPFPAVGWQVDIPFSYLEAQLESWRVHEGLDLDPDFQRAHVWTEAQQSAFVEYLLQNGPSARILYFASDGYLRSNPGPVTIVDGKQRLEAIRKFNRGELPVFGRLLSEYADKPSWTRGGSLKVCVADVDRANMLRWYLALNTGGTPHTDEEIVRVRALLEDERRKTTF